MIGNRGSGKSQREIPESCPGSTVSVYASMSLTPYIIFIIECKLNIEMWYLKLYVHDDIIIRSPKLGITYFCYYLISS